MSGVAAVQAPVARAPQPERKATRHFTDLDGMRGVLAVTVMLLHLGLNTLVDKATRGFIPMGLWPLCVDFFFILSGLVLYYSLDRARPSFATYLEKRLWRLAPVALLSLALILAFKRDWPAWTVILANAAMVQPYLGIVSINFPSWSISYELLLPALALPLLGWFRTAPRTVILVLMLALCVAAAVVNLWHALGTDYRLARALLGLGLGMLLARERLNHQVPPRPGLTLALFGGCLLIMLLTVKFLFVAVFFHPVAAACIFYGASTRTFFSAAPFQAIGNWSYSIYLLHIPVLAVVERMSGSASGSLVLKLVVLGTTLVLAACVFRWVERPLMRGGLRAPAQTAP